MLANFSRRLLATSNPPKRKWLKRSLAVSSLGVGAAAYFYPSETINAFNRVYSPAQTGGWPAEQIPQQNLKEEISAQEPPTPSEPSPAEPAAAEPSSVEPYPPEPAAAELNPVEPSPVEYAPVVTAVDPPAEPQAPPEPSPTELVAQVVTAVNPPAPEPAVPDPRIAELENRLRIERVEFAKKLNAQKRKVKSLNSSVEAVQSIVASFKTHADSVTEIALEAVALLHPQPDQAAVRLEYEDKLDDFKLAAFLPDHGDAPSFVEALMAKLFCNLFSFKAAEQTDGLKSVTSAYAGRNLHALFKAREAVRKADLKAAALILENETLGGVRQSTKEWASKARLVAQSQQARDLAKAEVYSRLSTLLV